MRDSFWLNKKIFLTGHTGFKGSWLCMWLQSLGAQVVGYALPPKENDYLFNELKIATQVDSRLGDIRNREQLTTCMVESEAEIIIHMAAQALVQESYVSPADTYETNVMGTLNLLEAVRSTPTARVVVIVSTDKCYENKEWQWGYRETDRLGGKDPYSSSKACTELLTQSYRNSFFTGQNNDKSVRIATVRAGNVIGGGDNAQNRLLPDIINSLAKLETIKIRSPRAIRPWQFVLEPLNGYMKLIESMYSSSVVDTAWNFGPNDYDIISVKEIVELAIKEWGDGSYEIDNQVWAHESLSLKLDCSMAKNLLNWRPRWTVNQAVNETVSWYKAYYTGQDMHEYSLAQIKKYCD